MIVTLARAARARTWWLLGALLATSVAGGAPSASAQGSGWRWESPRPQGTTLRDACVDSAGALWAAGELGTLGRLGADGVTWEPLAVRSTADLMRVACCGDTVLAVGTNGIVVRRDARGSVSEQSLSTSTLNGVACVGERGAAIGSGDGVWVSADGASFERRDAPHPIYALRAIGGDALIASGPEGAISRSDDLGRTWSTARTGARGNVLAIDGGPDALVAVGTGGLALRSADGGRTWAPLASGVSDDLHAVVRGARGEVVAVGAGVAIASRGSTSFTSLGPLPARFYGLVATPRGLVAVGMGGRIATRRGSGRFVVAARWESSLYGAWSDGTTRIVVGDRGFVARASGEGALRPVRVPTVAALHAVDGDARGVVLAVGAEGTILRSSDRGARWSRVTVPADRTFNSVWMDDEGHALCVGERGQRYRSDDGGRTWESSSLGTDDHFTGIAARGSTLWVVGARGRVERSDDLGRTWIAETAPPGSGDLRTPFVTARGTLIVTARPGTVARRGADGRWSTVELGPSAVLTGLTGDERELILVASDGSTYLSRDDGATWARERAITRESLTSIRAMPGGGALATGYWGTLLVRP